MPFETFDHTADVGLRITADDLPGLFSEAARGMFSLICANADTIRPLETVTIKLPSDDTTDELDALLRNWLAELLYLFHVRELLLCRFDVVVDMSGQLASLSATVHGEPVDRARHDLDAEIKAVTWHGLRIEHHDGGYMAEVIVDI